MTTVTSGLHRVVWRVAAPAIVIWALAPVSSSGQTLTTGAVSVRIVDGAGHPLTEVLLALDETASGVSRSATADREGQFHFGALAPGEYSLRAERFGFVPRRVSGIAVRPEHLVSLTIELTSADGRVDLVEERATGGLAAPVGAGQWVPRSAARALPGPRREVAEVVRFTSSADEMFSVEGLPAQLSALAIDGMPFRSVSYPSDADAPVRGASLTLAGFEAAQLITNPVDVEWSSVAASLLSGYSRRGTSSRAGDVFASWSGDALSPSSMEGGDVSWSDLQGGLTARGALPGEDSRYSLGVSVRRSETPVSAAWFDTDAAGRLAAAAGSVDLDAYRRSAALPEDAIASFANIDWSLNERHRVEAGVHVGLLPAFSVTEPRSGAIREMEGLDVVTNIGVLSAFGRQTRNELRIAVTSSERTDAADEDAVPFTQVVGDALRFGSSPGIASARDAQLRVSDALHFRTGAHALKLGGAVTLGKYRYEPNASRAGEYLYGDIDQFEAGNGVFARTEGAAPLADWTDRTFALFVQDRFVITSGVELVAGVRVERQTMPSEVNRDSVWAALTGIMNDEVAEPALRLSPRASLSWDVGGGRMMLHAAGGIYYDRMDPLLLATWQSDDGTSSVRRAIGALDWPPAGTPAGLLSSRLTVLSDGFEAPRTMRGTAGLVSRIGTGTTLQVTGVVRRTENLPRRTDLNLAPVPVARDQHGREVYGILVQQGALLAASPGSNRRFTTYDEVAAITADGVSNHIGVTAGIEHETGGALSVLARYTFGRTTDDWFGASAGGWTIVMPVGVGDAWVDGTSDYDVPHRAVLGAVVTGPIGMQFGAAYRLQSGRPFTPGFQPGVDANADGSALNDPAFVDASIPGIAELIGRHSCLAAGAFAERNSCRTAIVHALDVSIAVPLFRTGGAAASLMMDAFDLLESSQEAPDAALYLVDPAGSIVTDPVAGTVTLPLIANPDFGDPLARRTPGRRIRLGLSLNW